MKVVSTGPHLRALRGPKKEPPSFPVVNRTSQQARPSGASTTEPRILFSGSEDWVQLERHLWIPRE